MLLLEQYINLDYKKLGYKIYTTIPKNHMQKLLDAIIVKNQINCYQKQYYIHVPPFDM